MRVLVISDGHGAIDMLDRLSQEAEKADFILFGGDFADYGNSESGTLFLQRLVSLHDNIFSVTGNSDEPLFKDSLEEQDICIEGSLSYFNGLMLTGSGGGMKFQADTPNERTDEDLASDLHLAADSIGEADKATLDFWDNLVVIAHHPPKDTKLDIITSGIHVGSPLVRTFIEEYKPLLVVSGHIHESAAVDTLGPTTLINPGPLYEGNYAVVEISGGGKTPFKVTSAVLTRLLK